MRRLLALGLVLGFVSCRGEQVPDLSELQQATAESAIVASLRSEVAALHDSIGVLLERPVEVVVRAPEFGCVDWAQDARYWLCTHQSLSTKWTAEDFSKLQSAVAVR